MYIQLFISKKFSTLYGLIRNCTIINFRHFPLYTNLKFQEFITSVRVTEKIPCPNPYPSEKYMYTDIRSTKQKQTKPFRYLKFVNFRVEIWEQGWGPVLKAAYCY